MAGGTGGHLSLNKRFRGDDFPNLEKNKIALVNLFLEYTVSALLFQN